MLKIIILFLFFITSSFSLNAEEIKKRVVSLKNSTTNVRAGPGTRYPILWVFQHKNWPVRIISKYQYWYKIVDSEGEEGWVYKNLISNNHTVIVSEGEPLLMYRDSEMTKPMMKLSTNVVLNLNECNQHICQVSFNKREGWVSRERLLMVE